MTVPAPRRRHCTGLLGFWDWNGVVTEAGDVVRPAFGIYVPALASRERDLGQPWGRGRA